MLKPGSENSSVSHVGIQGPKNCSYYLLPTRVLIGRMLEPEAKLGLKLKHPKRGYRHPKWCLDHYTKHLTQTGKILH